MEIKIENARAALKTADEGAKKVLLALFPELKESEAQAAANRPITERVKTFADACRVLGEGHPFVFAYQNTDLRDPEFEEDNRDILAYMKLRIIATALNEGWEPQFKAEEWRWYPWFHLYTEEELSKMSDEWKADHLISTGDYAGFAHVNSFRTPSSTPTNVGSHLCFKNEALATYCGKQFIGIWADFCMIKK